MDNCDTYIINMKKDYGRRLCTELIAQIFNAQYFDGIDENDLDDHGNVIYWKKSCEYTRCAKKTKELILRNFLKTSKNDYVMIFEDDIYLHKNMVDKDDRFLIIDQLNNFLKEKKPGLLYLGVSGNFTSKNNNIKKIDFVPYNKSTPTTGAYAFILHRNYIDIIMTRINNLTFKYDPFDLHCLSYFAINNPGKAFITDPHIIVSDISSSNIRHNREQNTFYNSMKMSNLNYYIPFIGIMYVKIINIRNFDYFRKNITMFTPVIKLIYYPIPELTIDKEQYKGVIICDNLEECKKINFDLGNSKFHLFTSTDKKIKYNSSKLIFDTIEKYNNKCCKLNILNELKNLILMVEYDSKINIKFDIVIDI